MQNLEIICICAGLLLTACSRSEPGEAPAVTETAAPVAPTGTAEWGVSESDRKRALVRVGQDALTLGYLLDTVGADLRQWARVNGVPSAREKLTEAIGRYEDVMLLWHAAVEGGYDRLPEVQQVREERLVAALRKDLLAEAGPAYSEVSDADRDAYYAAHRDEFTRPAAMRVSHVRFASEPEAQRVLERLLAAERPNTVFAEIGINRVKNLGYLPMDLSRPVEPPTGLHRAADVPLPLRQAALELKTDGEILPRVVQSEQGFHILRRTGMRPQRVKTADQLRPQLDHLVHAEREEALFKKLVQPLEAKADVKLHEDNLAQVHIP